MKDNDIQPTDESTVETDGGTATRTTPNHQSTDYLTQEVNLLRPSTPFMREHLKVVWTGFTIWALIVFGPVTLTAIVPDVMTSQMPVLGFPLHYFLVALGAPGGALLLSVWYARKRDELDERYGIDHATTETSEASTATTDGGVDK